MNVVQDLVGSTVDDSAVPIIGTNCEYIKWLVRLENDVKDENLIWYRNYFHRLLYQLNQCASLFTYVWVIIFTLRAFTYVVNTMHILDRKYHPLFRSASVQISAGDNKNRFLTQFKRSINEETKADER